MFALPDVHGDDFHVPGYLAFLHCTDWILAEADVLWYTHVPLPSTGQNVSYWT